MQLKILLVVKSAVDTVEPCTALAMKFLEENQLVGILCPTDFTMFEHDNLKLFHSLSEAKDFEPNMVLPLDPASALSMIHYWENCKARTLYKDRLGLALNQLRSYGLSLLASAGVPTVNYMVLSNANDYLRYEAKRQEEAAVWEVFPDHPLATLPSSEDGLGGIAVQRVEGDTIHLCFLVNDSKLLKGDAEEEGTGYYPPIAFQPVTGLLRRGGLQDFRGIVGRFVNSKSLMALSRKVKTACQSMGIRGLVFLTQIYNEANPNGLGYSLHSTAPFGFLSMLMHSDILQGKRHEIIYSLLKDKKFSFTGSANTFFSLVVANPLYSHPSAPIGWGEVPNLVAFPQSPLPTYQMGCLTLQEGESVPDSLYEVCPTAEVKLDLEDSAKSFQEVLTRYGLIENKEGVKHEPTEG